MNKFEINEDMPVLVDLVPSPGARKVAVTSKDIEEKSIEALNSAMNTIHQMATYIVATMNSVSENTRPSKVEAAFGLKLTSEGNALITKAGLEANINVTLTWELKTESASNS
jgi:prophage DNA circulation protein